ncbi:MAG: T9SS type A sorting domain-containing protein [Bacteroidota bacterium]
MKSARLFSSLIILASGICRGHADAESISWSKIEGPYSGSVQALTVDHLGNVFASTSAGMYRSTDAGKNWFTPGLSFEFGAAFLVADSANNIYTGNGTEGMYESTDEGTSWVKSSFTGGVYSAVVLSGNRVCVGGYQEVSISSDSGKTWSASQITNDEVDVLSVAEDHSGNIYAGLEGFPGTGLDGGVYVSSDNGRTWKLHGMMGYSIVSIAVDAKGKVFTIALDIKGNPFFLADSGINSLGSVNLVTLSSNNLGEVVAVTDIGIFIYDSSLSSWKSVTPAISIASITSAVYNPNGTSYAGTARHGVFFLKSSSSTWVQRGIVPASITSTGFDGSGRLFAGTDDGVFEQIPADSTWLRVSDDLSRSTVYQLYFSKRNNRLYTSTKGGLFYLPDSGSYWIPLIKGVTYDFLESPDTDYVGSSGGILRAVGGEDIWSSVQTIGIPITSIYCLALDSLNNLFAGTSYDGIFISTDGGSFWTQGGVSSPLIFCSVKAMKIDHKGRIFAGTDTSGAYYSDDQGANWNSIPSINGKNVTCFLVNDSSLYFAGTSDRGAFISTDRGVSWHSANNGLTDSSIISINADQQGHLYAGTENGLFKSTGIVTRVDEMNEVPSSFSLFQNYPNPFNPTTMIRYQLSVNGEVTLKIYDVLGRLVKTLQEGRQTSGEHSVIFDARSLSSGTYFYRLTAGKFAATKKLMLIK